MSMLRRKHLETLLKDKRLNDSQMLEFVIRMVFHDDGSPRDFSNVDLRNALERHPNFQLILDEGVDDESHG